MAKNMVTRTFTTTDVECMVVGVETGEVGTTKISLSGNFIEEDGTLSKSLTRKAAKQIEASGDFKMVKIIHAEVNEQLYGIDENEFLAIAKKLPPRGTKTSN